MIFLDKKEFDRGLYKGVKISVKVLDGIIFGGFFLLALLIIGASLL